MGNLSTDLLLESIEVYHGGFCLSIASLRAKQGEVTCVMGPSGSGKSTLLQVVAGFLPVAKGTIRVGEREVTGMPPEKRRIALLFQRAGLFPQYTIFQNVEFPLRLQKIPKPERRDRVIAWLKRLGIDALHEKLPSQVSGGEAQRAAFARALIGGFPVVLLDEPFSALDVALRQSLRDLLRELVVEAKVAALLVTHDPEDAREVARSLYLLEKGRVAGSGDPKTLLGEKASPA